MSIHLLEYKLFYHSDDNYIIIICFLPLFNINQELVVKLNHWFFTSIQPFLHSPTNKYIYCIQNNKQGTNSYEKGKIYDAFPENFTV